MGQLWYVLPLFVLATLLIGWALVILAPLFFVVLVSARAIFEHALRSFYRHLPRRLKRARVSVFWFTRKRERLGSRLERELYGQLQAAAPGAQACLCLRSEHDLVRGNLRVWRENQTALVDIKSHDLGEALREVAGRLKNAGALPWVVGSCECVNCTSLTCPMRWRQIATA